MARIKSAARRQVRRQVRSSMLVLAFVGALAYYGSKNSFGGALGTEVAPGSGGNAATTARHLLAANTTDTDEDDALYPKEIFSKDDLKGGALFLHAFGVFYMFIALAIVCDECFVPALEALVEIYNITDDVAGATFMAAGGSAPELFTSLIGVFIAKSNVGFGTIIGSAVFNVLFVIGMCAFFSKELLVLTWWPLARDCSFYTFDLCMLFVFFRDEQIEWWEALLLILFYFMYVGFMFINEWSEKAVKSCLGIKVSPSADEESAPAGSSGEGSGSKEAFPPPADEGKGGGEPQPRSSTNSEPGTKRAFIEVRRTVYASTLDMMLHNVDAKGKGPNASVDKRFQRAAMIEAEKSRTTKEMSAAVVSVFSRRSERFGVSA